MTTYDIVARITTPGIVSGLTPMQRLTREAERSRLIDEFCEAYGALQSFAASLPKDIETKDFITRSDALYDALDAAWAELQNFNKEVGG